MSLIPHQAKYFAHDLTRVGAPGLDRLSMSLFDAAVDLNPHQIEAALFALRSPLSKGVLLADEVGLGKTIEAAIVLCQYWAERRRKLLVLCPAAIRKQWVLELQEKFSLPARVLDARTMREATRSGRSPLEESGVLVMSFHYAHRIRDSLRAHAWDLVVIDEAHKLRNAYRASNQVGQGIRWATQDCRKLLLTATPLQNSLVELYGLSTLIDEHLFGDLNSFRSKYAGAGGDVGELRQRLASFCKRTLRRQVTEYVRYTARRAITRPFRPSDDEHGLYEAVSAFLMRPDSYAIPARQRHLTHLVLRKLLASSSSAIAGTLGSMRERLEALRDARFRPSDGLVEQIVEEEEIGDDLLDEILSEDETDARESDATPPAPIDQARLRAEIEEIARLEAWSRRIGVDTKSKALSVALKIGFEEMARIGARRKAVIFTESRRTQDYLAGFLASTGYRGEIVTFNGSNSGPEATAILERWSKSNVGNGRATGSRDIDVRTALLDHFRDEASILIATEAAAEGVNLQFCSLVVNYDLPWNPQRIEQRIGRCHRYGQEHDVVVINFLNERNEADGRVLELLQEKFRLFDGVFGASDDVLGTIESGVDFEARVHAIYDSCRTPGEIEEAFRKLQAELDEEIQTRLADTRRLLFENFDEDVHERLRFQLAEAQARLDKVGRRFWSVTEHMLTDRARFDVATLTFDLTRPPVEEAPAGRYHLISKRREPRAEDADGVDAFLYRLSHPLGAWVLDGAKALDTPAADVRFDTSQLPARVVAVEALRGTSGHLTLTWLVVESCEREEYLLVSGTDEAGRSLDPETAEKLLSCPATIRGSAQLAPRIEDRLVDESAQLARATISRSLDENNRHFHEAREKLENWAEDMVKAAEQALVDVKEKIRSAQREARHAQTVEAQREVQEKIQKLEREQRRRRQEIFQTEDEIHARRDELIAALERRVAQTTSVERLFTLRWTVV